MAGSKFAWAGCRSKLRPATLDDAVDSALNALPEEFPDEECDSIIVALNNKTFSGDRALRLRVLNGGTLPDANHWVFGDEQPATDPIAVARAKNMDNGAKRALQYAIRAYMVELQDYLNNN
jgi:hypothetical protein